MEVRLFGEVQLVAEGEPLDAGTPRQQAVLAALLVDAGRPVPIETLIDRVWDADPPVEARNVLYSHVSRIRRLLKRVGATLERRPAGYVLTIEPDSVDIHQFWQLLESSKDADDVTRSEALSAALALWRGTPLAGIPGEWVEQVRDRWAHRRLDALVQWGDVELRLGRPDAVINALLDVVADYPLAEQLELVLMRALHAAGRDAEALDRYTAIRERLADELGTDPGPELRSLHSALLRGELGRELPVQVQTRLAPAQLPPDVYAFAGRDEELRSLSGLTAARIVVVSGTAGVGKTSLVVHWAHHARSDFPDGQLYLNLRGFDPTGSPVPPTEAVRSFLDALEVPKERIPAGFEAQVGLYRSLVADRRMLVVLDNARDAEQVRPLLPGAPKCLVLVTSRDQLAGLVAEGAHPLTVDLLDSTEARVLLAGRIGTDRVAAEPAAVSEIIRLCARLPLALAVVAARAATHPRFSLAALADELREGLDELSGADPVTDPRAVFSWSYLQLSAGSARLFRLLGLHPGPDVGTKATASLAGVPLGQVRPLLTELAQAHLVAEESPGRYGFHDLLRAYAAELAEQRDSEEDRVEVVRRTMIHYLYSANAADSIMDTFGDPAVVLPDLPVGVVPEGLTDTARAMAWFDAEYRVLLRLMEHRGAPDLVVWSTARLTRRYFTRRGRWHDSLRALDLAVMAARRLGDLGKEAFALCFIGVAKVRLGQYEEGGALLESARDLYHQAGDRLGEATALRAYCVMLHQLNRYEEALQWAQRYLDLYRTAGNKPGEGRALNAVGYFHALLGDYVSALNYCHKAMDLHTKLGDELAAAETWDSLGYANSRLGNHTKAISCYQAGVELNRKLGYRYSEANTLTALGDAYLHAGDTEAACAAWQEALIVFEQLGIHDADDVRAKLKLEGKALP